MLLGLGEEKEGGMREKQKFEYKRGAKKGIFLYYVHDHSCEMIITAVKSE